MQVSEKQAVGLDDLVEWLDAVVSHVERVAVAADGGFLYEDGHDGKMYEHLHLWLVKRNRPLSLTLAVRRILADYSHEGGETRALMLLAEAFDDLPGYREEWRLRSW